VLLGVSLAHTNTINFKNFSKNKILSSSSFTNPIDFEKLQKILEKIKIFLNHLHM
jgi:hypothetical protein